MDELEEYIEAIHNEPFNILSNNCIHKHLRIVNRARELGHKADLIGCISVIPIRPAAGFPLVGPHFYAEVDGETVDVSMEPGLEKAVWPNKDIIRIAPVNVSKLKPHDPGDGPPLPSGYFPPWPWKS